MARMIDALELRKRMCAICNQDYTDDPCEPSDCFFIRALNKTPTLTQPNEPLTLDELQEMDGEPVWWDDGDWSCWGIVTVDTDGFWAGIPFLRGRRNQINFEYNIKLNHMKIYRRTPEGEEDT